LVDTGNRGLFKLGPGLDFNGRVGAEHALHFSLHLRRVIARQEHAPGKWPAEVGKVERFAYDVVPTTASGLYIPPMSSSQVNRPATEPAPPRVVVADDQATVREGLLLMLGLIPDVSVVCARSYLTKDADRSEIANAIRSALSGLAALDRGVQAALITAATRGGSLGTGDRPPPLPADLPDGLAKREAEILSLLARGMANPDIAGALYLSGATVKSHINRTFAKTGSPDRIAAARYAREHGLV
jgi:DNA-binding NarL/FixJ family response regulator